MEIPLNEIGIRKTYLISRIEGDGVYVQHLRERGFVKGVRIRILRKTDPYIVQVNEDRTGLGLSLVGKILVFDKEILEDKHL